MFRWISQIVKFCSIAGVSLATLAPTPIYATDYTWTGGTGAAAWATNNWSPTGFPNGTSDTALVNGVFFANIAIDIANNAITLNKLTFHGDGLSSLSVFTSGSGTLTFGGTGALIEMTEYVSHGEVLQIFAVTTLNSNIEMRNNTSGSILISSEINGTGAVTITGTSPVKYGASNIYSGGTTVSDGLLWLVTTDAISGDLSLNGGTISTTYNHNQSALGKLELIRESTISLATGSHDWVFTTNVDTNNILNIAGWTGNQNGGTGGRIMFSGYADAAAAIGANTQFLNTVQFQGITHTGATFIDAGGGNVQLVPVPEPMTVFGIGTAGLGLVGWLRRRQSRTQPTI